MLLAAFLTTKILLFVCIFLFRTVSISELIIINLYISQCVNLSDNKNDMLANLKHLLICTYSFHPDLIEAANYNLSPSTRPQI